MARGSVSGWDELKARNKYVMLKDDFPNNYRDPAEEVTAACARLGARRVSAARRSAATSVATFVATRRHPYEHRYERRSLVVMSN
jgi:hypothetical protein